MLLQIADTALVVGLLLLLSQGRTGHCKAVTGDGSSSVDISKELRDHPMTQHLEDDDDNDKEDVDEGDLTSGVTNIHDELLSTSDTVFPRKSHEFMLKNDDDDDDGLFQTTPA
nr:hypothetical protein BaRGS_011916 [Batillaria attramentaria]